MNVHNVIRLATERKPWPMTENLAIMRLARWFDIRAHYCFPNVYFCRTEMDLAIITRPAQLLWEIEVKLSLSDWRADLKKEKWAQEARALAARARVARMYYAVLPEMLDNIPPFVTAETGLIALRPDGIHEVRPARRSRARPVTDKELQSLFESTYFRFWTERAHRHHRQKFE